MSTDESDESDDAVVVLKPSPPMQSWSEWLRPHLTPLNLFIAFMGFIIVVSGAILFLCLVGAIKFGSKDRLDLWIEVNSQILNGCFTLNAILVAPSRILNLYRLCVYYVLCRRSKKRVKGSTHNPYLEHSTGEGNNNNSSNNNNNNSSNIYGGSTSKLITHSYPPTAVTTSTTKSNDRKTNINNTTTNNKTDTTAVASRNALTNATNGDSEEDVTAVAKDEGNGTNNNNNKDKSNENEETTAGTTTAISANDGRPPSAVFRMEPARAVELAKRIERVYTPMLLKARGGSDGQPPSSDELAAVVPLRKWVYIILLLNLNHLFQWPITVAMWGWAPVYWTRPSYLVYGFLPLSFLAGTIGGVWMGMIIGRINKAKSKSVT